jgi:predicted HicB family RNase H-like nuclease
MTRPRNQTMTEILGEKPVIGPPLDYLQAHYKEIVAESEAVIGPQVPARLQGRGRPPKGHAVEPTRTHSLRVGDVLWKALEAKAQAAGISLNQAAQLAFAEWVRH